MAKVVLITGASSGIGYATAELLSKNGYKVYAGARRVEKMETLKNYGVVPLKLDVTDQKSAEAAVKEVIDAEGKIDVLFNNAGYGSYGPIETVTLEEAQMQIDVNVMGVARMTQLVLPYMRKQNSGRILITSSVGGKVTSYLGGWYHVSKFAVEALGNSIRMDTEKFGIKVSIIEPSGVLTEWGVIAADNLEEAGKGTVYEEECKKVAAYYRAGYTAGKQNATFNSSEKLAELVKTAIEAENPKTRYQDSMLAKMSVLMSRLCPDKFLDNMMKNTVLK
jgi:NADP-dependent 3-hydroxy acid dehydrogenase YdfG